MTLKRISPAEAAKLISDEGYVLVDVRSVPEFEAGHPAGAYNVPLNHAGANGMTPNPDFLRVMEATFPKDRKLVVACKAGGRSMKAATMLIQAGYSDVVDQRAGWSGAADPFGQGIEPGWQASGLPVATTAESGHAWSELVSTSKT